MVKINIQHEDMPYFQMVNAIKKHKNAVREINEYYANNDISSEVDRVIRKSKIYYYCRIRENAKILKQIIYN
jgi:hypothetical protein